MSQPRKKIKVDSSRSKWYTHPVNYLEYIIGAVVALLGWLFLERGKRKGAEALLENLEVKEKVLGLEKDSLRSSAELESERKLRAKEKKDLEERLEKSPSHQEMVDFIRRLDDRD